MAIRRDWRTARADRQTFVADPAPPRSGTGGPGGDPWVAQLVEARTALVNAARGLAKPMGEQLQKCDAGLSPALRNVIRPLLKSMEAIGEYRSPSTISPGRSTSDWRQSPRSGRTRSTPGHCVRAAEALLIIPNSLECWWDKSGITVAVMWAGKHDCVVPWMLHAPSGRKLLRAAFNPRFRFPHADEKPERSVPLECL